MSDFADSPKWTLVNDFTIHEDRDLSDRPFMLTCVPKRLDVEVTSFEVIRYIEWPSSCGDEPKPERYADASYIKFSGEFNDRVVVFRMQTGEVARFKALFEATIRPLPPGQIGGVHKATSRDGIPYSGMSSQEVPAAGLMEGEPGALTYLTAYDGPHGPKYPQHLTASLFLDEDKFFKLVGALSLGARPVSSFMVYILAELFETEVSASLSEPWMSHDFGLLMKGEGAASTAARLESLSLSTGATALQAAPEPDDKSPLDRLLPVDPAAPAGAPDLSRMHLQYQRLILAAIVVLILVTLFVR